MFYLDRTEKKNRRKLKGCCATTCIYWSPPPTTDCVICYNIHTLHAAADGCTGERGGAASVGVSGGGYAGGGGGKETARAPRMYIYCVHVVHHARGSHNNYYDT